MAFTATTLTDRVSIHTTAGPNGFALALALALSLSLSLSLAGNTPSTTNRQ
jgi:hypothetical protein